MGFGFRLNLRCSVPVQSAHSFANSPIRLSSSLARGRETSLNLTRLSLLSTLCEEAETSQKDSRRPYTCSSSPLEILDNDFVEIEETKINKTKRPRSSVHKMIDNSLMASGNEMSTESTNFQPFRASHFRLLMENLGILEETFADSEAVRLKKEIILQLGKFGALELFNNRLSKSLESPCALDCSDGHPEQVGEHHANNKAHDQLGKVVVRSRRKKENKSRKRPLCASEVSSCQSLPSKVTQGSLLDFPDSSVKRVSNGKNRRGMVARKEAEMSKAIKVLAELERTRAAMEEDTKQIASLSAWAEACGVDEKVLRQQLRYGRYCRDELIRSTRSLVLYLARNYRGMGIAMEDLLQAGYVGVLQGAERFDCTRGYRFSTYVQYWIRKSMSRMVTRYARGILIPWSLNRAVSQIQKARKALKSTAMKSPDDYEIAKMTGLSLDKIRSASNCLRVVGSINQKVGDCLNVQYMQVMPDTSIGCPEEAVMQQHKRKDIYDLLKGLNPRERQILTLRFGLNDHQRRSLEDIGRVLNVSKEWVRKIEKNALTKLRNESINLNLNYYLDL
ncbi:hypothetical protein L6164_015939 [Bauhinia variegata]|uniref:Uncharacterized protein n=1 Tax=Bauhinia variegata TaxID=167791 RepID=A0ACB9NSG6_BAUVA|nr:hypothetical protein L6164_015939 [Bauhinia variegata]